jgi:5-methyltetrahydropteroyltriglutamate--homocysteine methyltransferase
MLHFRGGRDGIDKKAYPDLDNFFTDLADIYQQEIMALFDLGCRYLQLDDTNLAYLCDPEHCERVRTLGEDPAELPALYAKLITECLKDVPEEMTTAIHLCRGNHRSAWAAEGGYEPVAEVMFNETGVDCFFLEYDDDRSGGFKPLRFVPEDKSVVLGLVSSKTSKMETPAEVTSRIREAGEVINLDQCCLSPQCGFSSTEAGNDISLKNQFKKLKLVVDVAEEFWGEKISKAGNY